MFYSHFFRGKKVRAQKSWIHATHQTVEIQCTPRIIPGFDYLVVCKYSVLGFSK